MAYVSVRSNEAGEIPSATTLRPSIVGYHEVRLRNNRTLRAATEIPEMGIKGQWGRGGVGSGTVIEWGPALPAPSQPREQRPT